MSKTMYAIFSDQAYDDFMNGKVPYDYDYDY